MLRGARLVTASETREGRAWNEQRVKAMTGGDPITARLMRQDNFTFRPTFKLLLSGNSKPVLRNVDEAWRRRFHIIPFTFRPRSVTTRSRRGCARVSAHPAVGDRRVPGLAGARADRADA